MASPLKVTTSSLRVCCGLRPTGLSTASGSARRLLTTSVAAPSTGSGSVEPVLPSGLSTASGLLRMLVTNSVSSQPVSGTSSSSRGALTSSTSARESTGNAKVSQVRSDVQEVGFWSQNSTLSSLVMPDEALLIASD